MCVYVYVCRHASADVRLYAANCGERKSGHLLLVSCAVVALYTFTCCRYCMHFVCILYVLHCMWCVCAACIAHGIYTVFILYPFPLFLLFPYHREWRPVYLGKGRPPLGVFAGKHQAAPTKEGGCHGVRTCADCCLWQPAHRW